MRLPTPVFMADIARAMQTPPPASEQSRTPAGPDPRFMPASLPASDDAKREAKNERDRLRRKAQRAAALKAAEMPKKKAAAPKRKKKKTGRIHALTNAAVASTKKKRRRGRPPGAKNKPKVGLAVALVPAPGVLRATAKHADAFGVLHTAMNAIYALPAAERINVMNMLNRLFS